ncbi:MAG TPA: LuxR C-terminal-related transcriptional regulator [Puia sp.]|nr:LuxR C-terminal-related transcriptional regulator [Puia sp.]
MMLLVSNALHERITDEFGFVPDGFLDDLPEGKSFVYLASCSRAGLIFMEPSPGKVTGFTVEEMRDGGTDMQISRIHPDDLAGLYEKALLIIRKNSVAAQLGRRIAPLVLNYRIRHADGEWRQVVETKVFRYFSDGKRDLVLGKVVDITDQAINDKLEGQKFITKPENDYPFLISLQKFKKNTEKRSLLPAGMEIAGVPEGIEEITGREKEILHLIGAGFSTKQIASQLFISINTVQTHRANLLRKLQVKNSMELIREVSKAFWL